MLNDIDLRGLTAGEDGSSEGHQTMSWIWTTSDGADALQGEGKQEALRIKWCKARACAHWWQEECLILGEEMRRIAAFYKYQEARWHGVAAAPYSTTPYPGNVDSATISGMRAFALRQAGLQHDLRSACQTAWTGLADSIGIFDDDHYLVECH